MADHSAKQKADIGARAFAWYWRRLGARTRDPQAFLRLVEARKAELDAVAARAERKVARARLAPEREETGAWLVRPSCLNEAARNGVLVDPPSGARLGGDLSIYHDDKGGAFTISQRPERRSGRGRYEIFFESYEFNGDYLSLSLGLPDGYRRPRSDERIVVAVDMTASWLMKGYLRLNIRGVGGEETFFAEGMFGEGEARFPFDFAFAPFELTAADSIWVDLIFDRPRMAEFSISEFSLALESD